MPERDRFPQIGHPPPRRPAQADRRHGGAPRQPRAARRRHQACRRLDRAARHTGRAVVFDSLEDLAAAHRRPDLDVTPDDVLVLRNAGPKGAPGMPESGYLPIPRKLAAAGVKDMVRISDARMSGTAFGTVVAPRHPRSRDRRSARPLRNGDMIRLDIPARRLDVLLDEAELSRRAACAPPVRGRPSAARLCAPVPGKRPPGRRGLRFRVAVGFRHRRIGSAG